MSREPTEVPRSVRAHYDTGHERRRLFTENDEPRLELVRTPEILERSLPPPPAHVLDVGGGPGTYAGILAQRGYDVHLIDPVPLHVAQARHAAANQPDQPFTASLGDARSLPEPDGTRDAVLLLGPLYHLTERDERLRALREALRVLKDDGIVAAVGISRFRTVLAGLMGSDLHDPAFRPIVESGFRTGQHRNPDPVGDPQRFTTAYLHRPGELVDEVTEVGFDIEAPSGSKVLAGSSRTAGTTHGSAATSSIRLACSNRSRTSWA